MLFICYPKCTTCQKAKKWLEANNIEFTYRHIAEENPSAEELKKWHEMSGLPLKKFYNTSGNLYKELNLKDKIQTMSDEEQYSLLSTNGMLVKRPIIVTEDKVLVGFKEEEYKSLLDQCQNKNTDGILQYKQAKERGTYVQLCLAINAGRIIECLLSDLRKIST